MKGNFSNVAQEYEKYRPKYPIKCVKYLKEKCDLNDDSCIVDIGAGTGIFTEMLLYNNLKVIAVEPNDEMRKILKEKLGNNKNLIIKKGTAENTTIDEKNADLITVAQAFHWFDIEKFRNECRRILKPNGNVFIIWNKLDTNNIIVRELKDVDYKYAKRYDEIDNVLKDENREEIIKQFFKNQSYDTKIIENNLKNNKEKFIGFNLSKSYSLRKGETNYKNYIKGFESIFEKYNNGGTIMIANKAYGYLGKIE